MFVKGGVVSYERGTLAWEGAVSQKRGTSVWGGAVSEERDTPVHDVLRERETCGHGLTSFTAETRSSPGNGALCASASVGAQRVRGYLVYKKTGGATYF